MDYNKIEFLKDCTSFQLIEEGYSEDEKWCVDHQYLLRISLNSDLQQLMNQATLTNKVHELDCHIPLVHDVGSFGDRNYMILDYIKGKNGETILPTLPEEVQYQVGVQVGETLIKMHSVEAPKNLPS